jgi:chemotaxis protein MotA
MAPMRVIQPDMRKTRANWRCCTVASERKDGKPRLCRAKTAGNGKGGIFLPDGGNVLPWPGLTWGTSMFATLAHLFDPLTLAGMVAGIAMVALFQNGPAGLARGLVALGPLLTADPGKDRDAARAAMLKIDQLAQLRGLSCTDRVKTANLFLTQAARKLANCDRADLFELWARQTLADRAQRHGSVHKFWLSVADAAPALGMAGTIVGLVGMFAAMNDPASLGPSMALALLTTFYGVVIANLVAAPVAARLADLSERELAWQQEVLDRMLAIARRENAPLRRASIREVA